MRFKAKVDALKLRVDYEGGLHTKTEICNRHGISPATMYRHAAKGNWEYACKREEMLVSAQTALVKRMGTRRAELSDQHLVELAEVKEELLLASDYKGVQIAEKRAKALGDIIRSERLALALPNEYKYVESKTETTFKVEDALKEIEGLEEHEPYEDAEYEIMDTDEEVVEEGGYETSD